MSNVKGSPRPLGCGRRPRGVCVGEDTMLLDAASEEHCYYLGLAWGKGTAGPQRKELTAVRKSRLEQQLCRI
ncbi:hypothetical protein NDU88_006246 [Pleurodeles waltl]|uniref:Uncharacterized protein n=1 Tax=Pleurodeles waltl TaxID=8319 RepID=A0AAV7TCY4_PLEWA|nr:hypothetical protein NDU88_006246 [Pleurodeles waltl]